MKLSKVQKNALNYMYLKGYRMVADYSHNTMADEPKARHYLLDIWTEITIPHQTFRSFIQRGFIKHGESKDHKEIWVLTKKGEEAAGKLFDN